MYQQTPRQIPKNTPKCTKKPPVQPLKMYQPPPQGGFWYILGFWGVHFSLGGFLVHFAPERVFFFGIQQGCMLLSPRPRPYPKPITAPCTPCRQQAKPVESTICEVTRKQLLRNFPMPHSIDRIQKRQRQHRPLFAVQLQPLPPVRIVITCARQHPSLPRGNIPPMTVPSHPRLAGSLVPAPSRHGHSISRTTI